VAAWRIIAGRKGSEPRMMRLGGIFIAFCMMLIAASLGAVAYLLLKLDTAQSIIVALATLSALALYNAVSTRLRDYSELGGQIADLSRGTTDLARQVAELGRRLAAFERQANALAEEAKAEARAETTPLSAELSEIGTLVKQLAETVAAHELRLAEATHFGTSDKRVGEADGVGELGEPESRPEPAEVTPRVQSHTEMVEAVRSAIDNNRVDLYLQPIVTLPQRKVRYYEAFTRLRSENGAVLQPSDFLDAAEAGGLISQIDTLQLFRSVQVLRRLQLKSREIGLFCNVAAATLSDPRQFLQILQFMEANRALAPSLMLEFRQSTFRSMGPIETESLAALRELGFRFCMDQITDLRLEPRDLSERGIRYVKVPAPLLLGRAGAPGSDIHAADLSDLLGRFGISLISERIETEVQVVDLLDYDVRFGQGFLFSPPRPVRADALKNLPDAAEATARERPDKPRERPAAGSAAGAAL
jgi:cyclic-di-GMP phosphodiesterase TipF (flagellum assembly factor)